MVAIPFLLFDGTLFGVIDTRLWGTLLIWVAAVLTDLVDGLLPAEGAARDPGQGAMTHARRRSRRRPRCCAAMPGVFVLIWSTGFIVARYGMPHAPPMKFLALRYALSVAVLSACGSRSPARLAARAGAVAAPGGHRRADACRLPGRRLGGGQGAASAAGTVGADRRPAAGADGAVARRPRQRPQARRPRASGSVWRWAWPAWCWWCGASSGVRRGRRRSTWRWRCRRCCRITVGTLYQKRHVAAVRCAHRQRRADCCAALVVTAAAGAAGDRAPSTGTPTCSARWPGRCWC